MITLSKKWLWAFAASLGLNLFLLGMLVVHLTHTPARGPRTGVASGPELLRQMVHTLGGPQDPRVRALWSDQKPQLQRYREQTRAARAAVSEALLREPFEREQLLRALQQLNQVQTQAQERSSAAVVSLAEQLTAEERARFAEQAKRGRPPRHHAP